LSLRPGNRGSASRKMPSRPALCEEGCGNSALSPRVINAFMDESGDRHAREAGIVRLFCRLGEPKHGIPDGPKRHDPRVAKWTRSPGGGVRATRKSGLKRTH
jgi:hypothetical protein